MSQCGEECIEAVGQRCGSRLQDQRRFDLDDAVVSHRRNCSPAGSLTDLARNDLLATPRGENDFGRGSNHLLWRNDTVSGRFLFSQFGKEFSVRTVPPCDSKIARGCERGPYLNDVYSLHVPTHTSPIG